MTLMMWKLWKKTMAATSYSRAVLDKVKDKYGLEVHTIKVWNNFPGVIGYVVDIRLKDERCYSSQGVELLTLPDVDRWVRGALKDIANG
jgi:hypothetical protein